MITNPKIICDVFSFLNKDRIERIQLVNRFWNNLIIRHKNILPLRHFVRIDFNPNRIDLYVTREEDFFKHPSYEIKFDGTNLSKIEEPSRYSQLTFDEVLKNLNDIVFDIIHCDSKGCLDNLLNLMKLITTKTGGRFRGRHGQYYDGRFGLKLNEIFDNYIIVDELILSRCYDRGSYIKQIYADPEIIQLPSKPKEISLSYLEFY